MDATNSIIIYGLPHSSCHRFKRYRVVWSIAKNEHRKNYFFDICMQNACWLPKCRYRSVACENSNAPSFATIPNNINRYKKVARVVKKKGDEADRSNVKRKTHFYASNVKMFVATRPTILKRFGPLTEWSRDANSVNKRNIELNENIRSVSISKNCGLYIKVGNLTKRTRPDNPLQLEPTLRRFKRAAAQWLNLAFWLG